MDFVDLQLRLYPRAGDVYPVELTTDGEQHARGTFAAGNLPWEPTTDPAEEGRRLFAALFASRELRDAWVAARAQSKHRRVRLWLDALALHALPWELLHDGDAFLAAGAHTPFSRYLPTAEPWGGAIRARPLRALAVISNPDDLDVFNLMPLDIITERDILQASGKLRGTSRFADHHAPESSWSNSVSFSFPEADFLEPPVTLVRLEDALQRGYHILHYVGHGYFNAKKEQAALYLQNDDGSTAVVRDTTLLDVLKRLAKPPRLIFLAACQSATPGTSGHLGLGAKLVAAGVPAVVAMRERITPQTTRTLTSTFYARLAEHGTVDLALNEARSHLLTTGDVNAAIPALWMRLRSGQLWEEDTGSESRPIIQNTYTAHQIGDGSIAQGTGARSSGKGSVVVGGNVGGGIITGDHSDR